APPEPALTRFGREFAAETARSAEPVAVIRLMIAEAPALPRPVGPEGHRGLRSARTRRPAGRTRRRGPAGGPDGGCGAPRPAGRRPRPHRSWYGAVQLDDAEIGRPVAGAVQIFLRAYTPAQGGLGGPSGESC